MTEQEHKDLKFFPKESWNDLRIYETESWYVNVRTDHHLLGWLIIVHKDMNDISLAHLKNDDLLELKKLILKLENLIDNTFNPDRFNYLQAGNVDSILHIHMIPRYSTNREFNGETFTDPTWGDLFERKKWSKLPRKETVIEIAKLLRSRLKE